MTSKDEYFKIIKSCFGTIDDWLVAFIVLFMLFRGLFHNRYKKQVVIFND